eukprot:scaffold365711_cov19-Prasinocladus_malaysianus.AAC.1
MTYRLNGGEAARVLFEESLTQACLCKGCNTHSASLCALSRCTPRWLPRAPSEYLSTYPRNVTIHLARPASHNACAESLTLKMSV